MRGRQFNRNTASRRDMPPGVGGVPVFPADQIPDFEVVIVIERLPGNRWESRLHWFLHGLTGDFPVIPEAEQAANVARTPTMAAHGFGQERKAVIESASQASALVDQFIQWATSDEET
jgi:hypothetical protein